MPAGVAFPLPLMPQNHVPNERDGLCNRARTCARNTKGNIEVLNVNYDVDPAKDARNSFAVAMQRMMRPDAHHSLEDGGAGVVWAGGGPLDSCNAVAMALAADAIGRDLVYLNFLPNHIEQGPVDVTIVAMREGILHRYDGCKLWSPADGGPALLIPRGKGCFSWDGFELVGHEERILTAIDEGVERARGRLCRMAAQVPARAASNYVTLETRRAA